MTEEYRSPPSPLSHIGSTADLFRSMYSELRAIAARQVRGAARNQTLNVTALVNEMYLKMSARQDAWVSDEHFLRTAAKAVRQIIVDYVRNKNASKRGAYFDRVSFSGIENETGGTDIDTLEFDSVLNLLEEKDPKLVQIIELRYFCGLTIEETAKILDTSVSTVKRDWNYARAWLFARMKNY